MTFPTIPTQATALQNLQALAGRAREQFTQFATISAASDITLSQAKTFRRVIDNVLSEFDRYASTPGLSAYAKAQFNDNALDIVAEYNAMHAAGVALRDWLDANIPAEPTYTPAQTAGFRAVAADFIASIS